MASKREVGKYLSDEMKEAAKNYGVSIFEMRCDPRDDCDPPQTEGYDVVFVGPKTEGEIPISNIAILRKADSSDEWILRDGLIKAMLAELNGEKVEFI